jgi:hypothetical protein
VVFGSLAAQGQRGIGASFDHEVREQQTETDGF